jgi:excisionase family DNA binding protein
MDNRAAPWTPVSDHIPGEAAWLSANAAAALLGVSQRTIRRAIARGDLHATKRGGVYQISPDALARYQTASQPPARPDSPVRREVPHPIFNSLAPSLTRPLTSLIGREHEVDAVRSLLVRRESPLLTLVGAGGVGKTRLALAAAAAATDDFPDGTVFVGLAALADPALLMPTIAQELGVRDGDRSLLERLGELLGERHLLLVLDNLEHLCAAVPRLLEL